MTSANIAAAENANLGTERTTYRNTSAAARTDWHAMSW